MPVARNVNDGCTLSVVFRTFLHKTNGSRMERDETRMSLPSRCSFLNAKCSFKCLRRLKVKVQTYYIAKSYQELFAYEKPLQADDNKKCKNLC